MTMTLTMIGLFVQLCQFVIFNCTSGHIRFHMTNAVNTCGQLNNEAAIDIVSL